MEAGSSKMVGFLAVGFNTDEFPIRIAAPEVGPAGMEESAGQATEGDNQVTRIIAFESSPR